MDKTCQYCNKVFSTPSNLKTHLKTSKKCLESRTDDTVEENNNKFECEFCNKIFLTKQNLTHHNTTCKVKKNININSTELQLSSLKEENKLLKLLFPIYKKG